MKPLLIELHVHGLVGAEPRMRRNADDDHRLAETNMDEGQVARRFNRIDAARHGDRRAVINQTNRAVPRAEQNGAGRGGRRLARIVGREFEAPAILAAGDDAAALFGDRRLNEIHRRAADEAGDEGVDRLLEHDLRRVVLLETPPFMTAILSAMVTASS